VLSGLNPTAETGRRNDGVLPSTQTVHAKTYPYARPTFYYTNGDPTGLAKQFLDFTISAAGQKIVQQVGFVPIP
jgi:phosphate transport system substrate-binding protein